MRARIFLLCSPLFAACGDTSANAGNGVTVRDSAGISIVESAAPSASGSPFEVVTPALLTIGAEDGPEELLLHRVSDALRLRDGRIVVANAGSHELRLFDPSGTYLTSVGREGGGPGEFSSYSALRLFRHDDEVLATDDNAYRVHAYNLLLEFLETRRFEPPVELPRPFTRGILRDGSLLAMAYHEGGTLRGPPGSVITLRFTLVLFDSTGRFVRNFGAFDGRQRYVNKVGEVTHYPFLPLTVNAVVRAHGAGAAVLRGDRAELELWSSDGVLTRLLRWPRERTRASEVYPRLRAAELEGLASANGRTRVLYAAFYEKDLPLPELVPLYQDAIVGEDQRIWVERYRTRIDDPTPRWDVIDTTGRWLGTVETPRDVTIYQIGTDFLLGLQRDSLGVERVVMHRVQRRESR